MTGAKPRRRWALAGAATALAVLFTACAEHAPQSALEPEGPIARRLDNLWDPVFLIAVGVFVLVEGLLVFALIRFRHRRGRDDVPPQIHGNTRLELFWTVVPALILAGIAVPTVATILDLSRPPPEDRLNIEVVGHQWWWEVTYPDHGFTTANEIHIPTDRAVYVTLRADDVIHSFWVPKLAGKQDLIPGRVNNLTLIADEPGPYPGQCAEYCGIAHAYMRFFVYADEPQEFDAWVEDQRQPHEEPTSGLARQGLEIFNEGNFCIRCHVVDPQAGAQTIGPSLAHFASRETFAAGLFENNRENLRRWLDDPPEMKPGVLMPDYGLSEEQIEALIAYLETLE